MARGHTDKIRGGRDSKKNVLSQTENLLYLDLYLPVQTPTEFWEPLGHS